MHISFKIIKLLPLFCSTCFGHHCVHHQELLIAAHAVSGHLSIISIVFVYKRPPLWSSGQSFWLQIKRYRVRFPALPHFLSSSGSGTGSTQPREPREVNWGATWIKRSSGSRTRKHRFNGRGDPLRWPRDTTLSAKVGTNFADRRRPLCRYSSLAD
jgi:hypothetical protein